MQLQCARRVHSDEVRTAGIKNDDGATAVIDGNEGEHWQAQQAQQQDSLLSEALESATESGRDQENNAALLQENAKPRSDFLSQAEELMAQLNASTSTSNHIAIRAGGTSIVPLEPKLESEAEQLEGENEQEEEVDEHEHAEEKAGAAAATAAIASNSSDRGDDSGMTLGGDGLAFLGAGKQQQEQQEADVETSLAISSADTTGESLLPPGFGGEQASISFGGHSPIVTNLDDRPAERTDTQKHASGAEIHGNRDRESAGESTLQLYPDFVTEDDCTDDPELDVLLTEHAESQMNRQGHQAHEGQQRQNKHGRTLDPPTPEPPLPAPRSPAAVVKHIRAGMRAQGMRNSDLLRNLKTTKPDPKKSGAGGSAKRSSSEADEADLVDAAGLGAALKALHMPMNEVELTNLLEEIGTNEQGCVSLAALQAYLKRGGRRQRGKSATTLSRPAAAMSSPPSGYSVSVDVMSGLRSTSNESNATAMTEIDSVAKFDKAHQAQVQQQAVESSRVLAQKLDKVRRKLQSASYGKQGQDPARLFRQWDRSKTGAISIAEFENAIRKGGEASKGELSDAELRLIFLAADTDGDGAISVLELTEFVWGSLDVLHDRLTEAILQGQLTDAAEQKLLGSKAPFSPFWSAKMGRLEPDRQSPVAGSRLAGERSPRVSRDSPSPQSINSDEQQASVEGHGQGGFVSLRAQVTALQRQLLMERERRQASDDRAKHAEQRARYQFEQEAAHELRQKAKLAGVAASAPLVREAKEMEAEVVRLRTMVRELKRERAKTIGQQDDTQRRHEAQVSAGQTRRLKQLEAEMVTIRADAKRLTSERDEALSALKKKDEDCKRHQKEATALKRLLAEAKTRQDRAVSDALAAAEAQITALQARNSRLLKTMQAAAVAPLTYGHGQGSPDDSTDFGNGLAADSPGPIGNSRGRPATGDSKLSRRSINTKGSTKKKGVGAKAGNKKDVQPKARYGRQPLAAETALSPEVEKARMVARVALANKRDADQLKQLQSAADVQHIRYAHA